MILESTILILGMPDIVVRQIIFSFQNITDNNYIINKKLHRKDIIRIVLFLCPIVLFFPNLTFVVFKITRIYK